MKRISLLAMALLLLGTVVAVRVRAAKLDTSTLLGVWDGTFTNETFGTNGTIHVETTVESPDSVRVDWTLNGNVFGCGSVGPVGGVLLRNLKSNGFTDTKVFVKGEDSVFGTVKIKSKGTNFKARGKNPCDGVAAKKYRAKATLEGGTLTGTMKIKLAGSGTAQASFTVTKAP
jgi:hypothetical protein